MITLFHANLCMRALRAGAAIVASGGGSVAVLRHPCRILRMAGAIAVARPFSPKLKIPLTIWQLGKNSFLTLALAAPSHAASACKNLRNSFS